MLTLNLKDLIAAAFAEDIPSGDVTTDNLGIQEKNGYAFLIAKADIKLSGQDLFSQSIHYLDPQCQIRWFFKDGDTVLKNQKMASLHGNLLQIIKAERVALNFLGRLSGIATHTHLFVSRVGPTKIKILDTRKTLPGYRVLEKKAVVDGGGYNHRKNLSDAVLIKENHIRLAGSISHAVNEIRKRTHVSIEVEVTSLNEVDEAVGLKVNRLLLDNMNKEMIRSALDRIPDDIEVEASGNMTVERVKELSDLEGLDYVSVGALTHSAPCADISLLFDFK
ncbi:MAG: carboxylating nicotinate-nucleotide diphosphorylase [Bdellovibrionaceae bacterium]|nr:carboxylating nicotinate-nucleotide diphosphorylase [Pseudobdellovibrionaceae bacterium]